MMKNLKNSITLNLFAFLSYIPAIELITSYISDLNFSFMETGASFYLLIWNIPILIAALILGFNEFLICYILKHMNINVKLFPEKAINNTIHNVFLAGGVLSFLFVLVIAVKS